jgi:hypothetical protein
VKLVERSDEEDCFATRLVGTPGYLPPELVLTWIDLHFVQPDEASHVVVTPSINLAGQFSSFT